MAGDDLLVKELTLCDGEYFFQCFRVTPAVFDELLNWSGLHLQKNHTKMWKAVSPSEKLPVCLRYLVKCDAQVTIGASCCSSQMVVKSLSGEVTI